MTIIAFFNLKKDTERLAFHQWVHERQVPVFRRHLPKMKDFRVLPLADSDNYPHPCHVVQLFEWDGTADEWRGTLESFRNPQNSELFTLAREWIGMCDDESTQILYAGETA